nr:putative RNA-dependent RNA polymerase [Rhizoctonia solani partitivirus 14]
MEELMFMIENLSVQESGYRNLRLTGRHEHRHHKPDVNTKSIQMHQKVLEHAFRQFLTPVEISSIIDDYRRTDVDYEAIMTDFFANNVPKHDIIFDQHLQLGLQCMADAFRPPRRARPCHLNDVEHHYPYKWNVNSEAPFSTDKYFLDRLPTYRDFWDPTTKTWGRHIDPIKMMERFGDNPTDEQLDTQTPAKFGFQKSQIFSYVRRWHHIIKDDFKSTTGLDNPSYFKDRYIFPMILHTKTAIVKRSDPNKMRTIWGCSKVWVIAETMLYWEYIAWVKKNRGCTPMLWGFETFTSGWLRLNNTLYNSLMRNSFITLDWKRFDKRAYFPLILHIMWTIRDFLDFDNGYCPNVNYPTTAWNWNQSKSERIQRLWLWTLDCLFNSAIITPDGWLYIRLHAGIPSGLFITQLLDSWYNYTMIATLLSAIGLDPKRCIIKVQGDDSVVRLYVIIPPDMHDAFLAELQRLADHYFRSVISMEKSEVRNTLNGVEVLSYRNCNGYPYRDELKMLAQFYYTKARNPSPSLTMAAAIGFAFAACGNHPRVHMVLEDVYNHYKLQGYTPNAAGLNHVFGDSPDRASIHIPLDHFPDLSEVRASLLNYNHNFEVTDQRTWPLDYFLFDACK